MAVPTARERMSATPCHKVINIHNDFWSLYHLVKARVCPGEVEVGLILILEKVLNVTHLMVHSNEILLIDPGTLLNAEVLKVKMIKG